MLEVLSWHQTAISPVASAVFTMRIVTCVSKSRSLLTVPLKLTVDGIPSAAAAGDRRRLHALALVKDRQPAALHEGAGLQGRDGGDVRGADIDARHGEALAEREAGCAGRRT